MQAVHDPSAAGQSAEDDEGRAIDAVARVVVGADMPIATCAALIRLAGNAIVHQFTRPWEGHERAAREHARQAEWHRRQAAKLMPIVRRAR